MRAYRVVNCAVLCAGLWLGACGGGGDDDNNPGDGTGGTGNPGGGTGGTGQMMSGGGGSNVTGGSGGSSSGMMTGSGGKTGSMNSGTGGTSGGGSGGMGGMMTGTGGTTGGSSGGDGSVLQYHKNASRDGMYVEPAFTRAAAATLKVDSSFNATVDGPTYAQPLFFDGGGDGKDLVIVATESNQVSAFNADDGSTVWQKSFGNAVSAGLPCGNISPLGITGTPVIDPKSKTLYFDTMTDGPKHLIHAVSLADGSEVTGWPLDVNMAAKAGSLSFDSSVQNQRGALIIVKDMLYVPYGGHYGDCGQYHGWVVGVSLSDPTKVVAWATRAQAGGIWAPGGIASDGTSLFVATGNTMADSGFGLFTAPDTYGDGESVIKLPGDLKYTMADTDFAAAMNWSMLDMGDSDIGGSGPVLFEVPGATPSKLAIALGKDGSAYLLDPSNLGGTGHWLASKKVSSDQIIQAAVAYTTATGTFVTMRATGQGCPSGSGQMTALSISAASPPAISVAWCAGDAGSGSPIVTTTDGMAESIVWLLTAERGNALLGYNGETGEQVFDGGGADLGSISRFQTPMAAKGRIWVASDSKVTAFKP